MKKYIGKRILSLMMNRIYINIDYFNNSITYLFPLVSYYMHLLFIEAFQTSRTSDCEVRNVTISEGMSYNRARCA